MVCHASCEARDMLTMGEQVEPTIPSTWSTPCANIPTWSDTGGDQEMRREREGTRGGESEKNCKLPTRYFPR